MPVPTDQLAGDITDLTKEVKDLGKAMTDGMAVLRTDLAGFQGEVKSDLRWIKGIGGALLAASGWVIWNAATVTADVRHQGVRIEKVEKRLDGMDSRFNGIDGRLDGMAKQLDILIRRGEPKKGE